MNEQNTTAPSRWRKKTASKGRDQKRGTTRTPQRMDFSFPFKARDDRRGGGRRVKERRGSDQFDGSIRLSTSMESVVAVTAALVEAV